MVVGYVAGGGCALQQPCGALGGSLARMQPHALQQGLVCFTLAG